MLIDSNQLNYHLIAFTTIILVASWIIASEKYRFI